VFISVMKSDACQLHRFHPLLLQLEVIHQDLSGRLSQPVLVSGDHSDRASFVFVKNKTIQDKNSMGFCWCHGVYLHMIAVISHVPRNFEKLLNQCGHPLLSTIAFAQPVKVLLWDRLPFHTDPSHQEVIASACLDVPPYDVGFVKWSRLGFV
jgi:hypothetical protein